MHKVYHGYLLDYKPEVTVSYELKFLSHTTKEILKAEINNYQPDTFKTSLLFQEQLLYGVKTHITHLQPVHSEPEISYTDTSKNFVTCFVIFRGNVCKSWKELSN